MSDAGGGTGSGGGTAAERWAGDLAAWRIPDAILEKAPQSPWIHPVELFVADPGTIPDSPSHRRAREAVPERGSVLDVGSGGGRAAFAVAPPAASVVGVDHQDAMLAQFAAVAQARDLAHREVLGDWPAVAADVPVADVVVCHHVVYNVAALPAFVLALDAHARRRVVVELPQRHPLYDMAPLWRHFWGLERPEGPTAQDALAVVRDTLAQDDRAREVHLEAWQEEGGRRLSGVPWEKQVEFMRIRLCLTADRDGELAEVMAAQGPPPPRRLATLWWDVPTAG